MNSGNHTVNVTVPYGTDRSDMVATFTLSDQATARVSGSLQESGVSSLNFSSPVTYNITSGRWDNNSSLDCYSELLRQILQRILFHSVSRNKLNQQLTPLITPLTSRSNMELL